MSHKCVNDLFFCLSKNESLSVKQKHSGGLKYLNNGDWLSVCVQICESVYCIINLIIITAPIQIKVGVKYNNNNSNVNEFQR